LSAQVPANHFPRLPLIRGYARWRTPMSPIGSLPGREADILRSEAAKAPQRSGSQLLPSQEVRYIRDWPMSIAIQLVKYMHSIQAQRSEESHIALLCDGLVENKLTSLSFVGQPDQERVS
jgi:hypothetical protein